jgi:hypothetical protein
MYDTHHSLSGNSGTENMAMWASQKSSVLIEAALCRSDTNCLNHRIQIRGFPLLITTANGHYQSAKTRMSSRCSFGYLQTVILVPAAFD